MNENLINILKEIALFIKKDFGAQKVILFGSYAKGNITPDSDIDLFIIMDTKRKFPEEGAKLKIAIREKFNFYKPMDILVRNQKFIDERIKENDFFIKDIINKGKEL
ncbi:MAG: nucleotidyltransferase domain-containing protein [Candidatus Goldbacteria bacterium]|nr:nucleotidyltransferase domain-containing protein [Candidatus Goldiibacteriota bacterium]